MSTGRTNGARGGSRNEALHDETPRNDVSRTKTQPTLALALLGVLALACGGGEAATAVDAQDGIDDTPPTACLWETNELLSHVEVRTPEVDCGQVRPGDSDAVDCFTSARGGGEAAQVTINNCIDCLILSTFVSLPTDGEFHLYREADFYGDDMRVVRVEACGDVAPAEGNLSCAEPSILYRCTDALPDPSTL
jgi:hypothetical protein